MHLVGVAALAWLAPALGLNNFAAALALGVTGEARPMRSAVLFGAFETLMPLAGMAMGAAAVAACGPIFRWIGAALLAAAGLYSLLHGEVPRGNRQLWLVALLASLDNLAGGVALGASPMQSGTSLGFAAALIGLSGALLTLFGVEIGRRAGRHLGIWCQRAAAILLLAAAVAMAAE